MSAHASSRRPSAGFAKRPGTETAPTPEAWVREPEAGAVNAAPSKAEQFTARLTIDITPELRGRIKIAAFRRGQTVADMLRAMLADAFPNPDI